MLRRDAVSRAVALSLGRPSRMFAKGCYRSLLCSHCRRVWQREYVTPASTGVWHSRLLAAPRVVQLSPGYSSDQLSDRGECFRGGFAVLAHRTGAGRFKGGKRHPKQSALCAPMPPFRVAAASQPQPLISAGDGHCAGARKANHPSRCSKHRSGRFFTRQRFHRPWLS